MRRAQLGVAVLLALVTLGNAASSFQRRDGSGGGHGHGGSGGHGGQAQGGGHGHGGGSAPGGRSGYQAPAPQSGYQQPASGYQQPSAPSQGYGGGNAGGSGYGGGGGSGYGQDDNKKIDPKPILLGLAALLGLSLLFPTFVSITTVSTGRRKRSADEDVNPLTDVVERVNDIYMSVVESEECIQRIACEVGGLASDVGLKENTLTEMAGAFVPSKYKAYYKQFQSGQDCHKIKCGNIF